MDLGAAPKLLKLLDEGTSFAKDKAAGAIWSLAVNADNKVKLMDLGAARTLLKLRDEGTLHAQEYATDALRSFGHIA